MIRLMDLTVDEQLDGMEELLVNHVRELSGPVIVTVTHGGIRIRRPD
jgi:hypothetical protein